MPQIYCLVRKTPELSIQIAKVKFSFHSMLFLKPFDYQAVPLHYWFFGFFVLTLRHAKIEHG